MISRIKLTASHPQPTQQCPLPPLHRSPPTSPSTERWAGEAKLQEEEVSAVTRRN